ncbi:Mitochondrial oxaloacetate transport protein [Leucoagaricus sp. SymC.cos]|nr:Mitochondrial oxaloacetate transport protein [Leucoagaricus sp. SymC.cos]
MGSTGAPPLSTSEAFGLGGLAACCAAYSPALPVGTQRFYRNSVSAFSEIVKREGVLGLMRGTGAACLRTAMGSSVQVPSYVWTKRQLAQHGILPADSFWIFLASSSVSGLFVVSIVFNPLKCCVLTRMYNQPTKTLKSGRTIGLLYQSPIDALIKIARAEGFLGWYKGTMAHFLRILPQTIITLTANDSIIKLYRQIQSGKVRTS